jgi:hypothetical protein
MMMEAQAHAQKMQQQEESAMIKSASDIQMANIFSATERAKSQQMLVQKDQQHKQTLQQKKEQAKSSQTKNSKSGSGTK